VLIEADPTTQTNAPRLSSVDNGCEKCDDDGW
jgi:hypothetical protein